MTKNDETESIKLQGRLIKWTWNCRKSGLRGIHIKISIRSTLIILRAEVYKIRPQEVIGFGTGRKKLSVLGTSGDHLGPLGTIWGPSGTWIRWSYRFHYGIGPSGVRGSIRLVFRSTDARILWKNIHIKKSNIQKEWKKIKNGENRHGIINPL